MARFRALREIENQVNPDGVKICRNCSNIVPDGRRHYCSKECMEEFNRNNTWFFVRKDVLRRDHYRCSICKKRFRKKDLDVDHIIPMRTGIDPFDKENLRTLCKECHRLKTALERESF